MADIDEGAVYGGIASRFVEMAEKFPKISWSLRFEDGCIYVRAEGTDKRGTPIAIQNVISSFQLVGLYGGMVNDFFLALTMDMSAAGFFIIDDAGAQRVTVGSPQSRERMVSHLCGRGGIETSLHFDILQDDPTGTPADSGPVASIAQLSGLPVDNGQIRVTRYEGRCSECGEDIVILSQSW